MSVAGSRQDAGASADILADCAGHGIETEVLGFDGLVRPVPEATLRELVALLGPDVPGHAPAGIRDVLDAPPGRRCYLPEEIVGGRVWGLTCQLASLVSARNCGMGDFADLAELCRIAAAEGADFVGVNPLHALFWSDPARDSPFFPSNRRFLNPLYVALDWIEGFAGFDPAEEVALAAARRGATVDLGAVSALKKSVLRRLFEVSVPDPDFSAFRAAGGRALRDHALFEALSASMSGHDALPAYGSPTAARLAEENEREIDFHLWLQWHADRQLRRVRDAASAAGMRIGLYLDFAVGCAPDGSAAWSAPDVTMPGISIGAPPDPFSTLGQDWGLAPLSPAALAREAARPYGSDLAAAARYAGALRIDHAMSLARLWMIPRGRAARDGAFVRNPLPDMLDRLAEASAASKTLIIGEDLGVVPPGFRDILAQRAIHRYIVYFFERWEGGFSDPSWWPRDAIACVGTHDMPSFAGWWAGSEIELGHALGFYGDVDIARILSGRERDREILRQRLCADGQDRDLAGLSLQLHREIAASPCRLAVLQIEDALGLEAQVNMPGTVAERPNWRHKLPVDVERLAADPSFRRHAEVMREARPR